MPLAALAASDVDYQTPIAELGHLLGMLAVEPRGPSPPPPEDIRLEVEIALGRAIGSQEMISLATPVARSCPACGGVLSQNEKVKDPLGSAARLAMATPRTRWRPSRKARSTRRCASLCALSKSAPP